MAFNFRSAFVRAIPKSLPTGALRTSTDHAPICLKTARAEHAKYVTVLKQIVPEVHELPAIDDLPDSCFVEDTAIIVDKTAFMPIIGAKSRHPEQPSVEEFLKTQGLNIVKMQGSGTLDGGDVLYTGKELFVGISKRTTLAGAEELQRAFPHLNVHTITVPAGLHLKSALSLATEDVIAVVDNAPGNMIWSEMQSKSQVLRSVFSRLPIPQHEAAAANVVFANGKVLHRGKEEFPDSAPLFSSLNVPLVSATATQIHKVDGALTCCSVLY